MEIRDIDMSLVKLSEFNTRKDLESGAEDAGLQDLANSIKENGLLNPITVKQGPDGLFNIIAGQRRFLACRKLGWETVPAIIRNIEDNTEATVLSLIENVQRADMNPMDKAKAYQQIYEKYDSYTDVARATGVSVSTIKKYMSLLNLAPSIQASVSTSDGVAGVGTLSKIAETFQPDEQENVLKNIGGFKQQIQLEMVAESGGDLGKLETLREKALGGAFDVFLCRGIDQCRFIPDEIKEKIKSLISHSNED